MSEEKIQILYTGDFADGTGVKLEEINKQLCEKLGISVEFLTGDTHISEFAACMQKEKEKAEERRRVFTENVNRATNKAFGAMFCKMKRMAVGLDPMRRAKNIHAMRAGKYKMKRTSPETRARRIESAKEIAWIPKDMRETYPLW